MSTGTPSLMVLAACALALRQGSPPKGAAAPAFRISLLFSAIVFSLKGDLMPPRGKLGLEKRGESRPVQGQEQVSQEVKKARPEVINQAWLHQAERMPSLDGDVSGVRFLAHQGLPDFIF
jgi:hypothetical protein